MCVVKTNHNHCRPWMAFNSHRLGHYSTFQHVSGKQHQNQQQKRQRKQTFINAEKRSNTQDKVIEITSTPKQIETKNIIISKLSSITHTITSSTKAQGRAILLIVSFLYGTLNVTLRAIYASDGAPAASVLSFVRQCLSVLTFIPIIVSVNRNNEAGEGKERVESSGNFFEDSDDMWSWSQEVSSTDVEEDESKKRPMWLAAAELAFWNFGAQVRHFKRDGIT